VQAAEFLGCKEVEEDILNHLCTLLLETLNRAQESFILQSASLDSVASPKGNHAYGQDWHNMQVCACTELLALSGAEVKKRTGQTEGYISCSMPRELLDIGDTLCREQLFVRPTGTYQHTINGVCFLAVCQGIMRV
jgi:hypothetical protein